MRLFVDRDAGPRIGRALREVGVDVTLHRDWYPDQALIADTRWVAEATQAGLVILTKDTKIRTRPAERAVFEAVGARGIVLATRAANQLEMLRGLLIAWPRLEDAVENLQGPFMLGVDRKGSMTRYF